MPSGISAGILIGCKTNPQQSDSNQHRNGSDFSPQNCAITQPDFSLIAKRLILHHPGITTSSLVMLPALLLPRQVLSINNNEFCLLPLMNQFHSAAEQSIFSDKHPSTCYPVHCYREGNIRALRFYSATWVKKQTTHWERSQAWFASGSSVNGVVQVQLLTKVQEKQFCSHFLFNVELCWRKAWAVCHGFLL